MPGISNFLTELALLLNRHGHTYQHPSLLHTQPDHLTDIISALIPILRITQHHFANPITRHPDLSHFSSTDATDVRVGATATVYDTPFHGSSLVTPPNEPEQIHKALKWAIMSCQSSIPSLTLMLISSTRTSTTDGYERWLSHKAVQTLCTIHQNDLTKQDSQSCDGLSRHTTKLLLIGNCEGLALGTADCSTEQLRNTITSAVSKQYCTRYPNTRSATTGSSPTIKLTKRFEKAQQTAHVSPSYDQHPTSPRPEVSSPPMPQPTCYRTHEETMIHPMDSNRICTHSQPGQLYFTDGSAMEVPTAYGYTKATGSAFVTQNVNNLHSNSDPYTTHLLKPAKPGLFNENYRAELVPIHGALSHDDCDAAITQPQRAKHIYTDSLAAIHAIRSALFKPHNVKRKLHHDIVQDIASLIKIRAHKGLHTHIHKVKAHANVLGNEIADRGAKEAARLSVTDHPFEHMDYSGYKLTIPPYWAFTTNIAGDEARHSNTHTSWHVRNPRKDIRKQLERRHLNMHPPTTTYGKGLAADIVLASVCHRDKAWNTIATEAQSRTMIKVLTGQIMNFKLISMYTKGRTSAMCPLCQAPDSTSHIVCGGCTNDHMLRRVIKRHDLAVQALASAILKGSKGKNPMLTDANITLDDRTTTDQTVPLTASQQLPKRLPAHLQHLLAERLRLAVQRYGRRSTRSQSADLDILKLLHAKYSDANTTLPEFLNNFDLATVRFRPDIAMFEQGNNTNSTSWSSSVWTGYTGNKHIHLVELGYTREGFAAQTKIRKRNQHRLLERLLQDMGWTVHYHTAILGVAGTIYRDTLSCAKSLGVSHSHITKLANTLMTISINHTHGLVTQRRALDAHHINKAFYRPP